MKILFLSAEVVPFAKAGGLADVSGSLPKALAQLGHDVRIVQPAYRSIEDAYASGKWGLQILPSQLSVPVANALLPAGAFATTLPGSTVPVYFIGERNLLGRPNIYGYDDDPFRFSFFCRAAIELTDAIGWEPEVVHAHDWHTAPALTWLATTGLWNARYRSRARVFTIHNLAHQGRSSRNLLQYLGVDASPLREESSAEVNFMARGIFHSHVITTVSPTYAREITTAAGGAQLQDLLRFRQPDLFGVLNGLDLDVWNPAADPNLPKPFDTNHLDQRSANKASLQSRLGLPVKEKIPLVAMVSRLDAQKGLDITGHVIHMLLNGHAGEAQFVVLGSGNRVYEEMFAHLNSYHTNKMKFIPTYAPDLAPLIYGGSDVFLMPSLFEPCGLGQMIAMHYGSLPVVRATGGLADTVADNETGFTFSFYSAEDFWNALRRALSVFAADREVWRTMQQRAMSTDFSWQKSAQAYQHLYELARSRAGM